MSFSASAARFITEQEHYSIAFPSITDKLPTAKYCMRCKNKLYAINIDDVTRFNGATTIVQSTFSVINEYWNKIPTHDKDRELVAKTLLEMANSK